MSGTLSSSGATACQGLVWTTWCWQSAPAQPHPLRDHTAHGADGRATPELEQEAAKGPRARGPGGLESRWPEAAGAIHQHVHVYAR